MMNRRDAMRWCAAMAVLAMLAGCAGGDGAGGGDQARAAADRAKAQAGWKLTLDDQGNITTLTLTRMDIYVSEDEEESEIFEILGDGVALVGLIPAQLAVGYDEAFDHLVGRPIAIQPSGGDPREPKSSSVTLSGMATPVSGGTFTVNKITGKWAGSEGDKTLHGTVELKIPTATGERIVTGAFAVHAVTWG